MKRFGIVKGTNYVPAYAHSHAHMWYDYREDVIERELGWAQEITLNSLRMFVPTFLYQDRHEELMQRFDRFLETAAKHGMTVMPTFYQSIKEPNYNPDAPGALKEPVINFKYGVHGGQWSYPGETHYLKVWPGVKPIIKDFVQGIVRRYAKDERIVAWDLMNEAAPQDRPLVDYVFACGREIDPMQPLTASWEASDISDVFNFHTYARPGTTSEYYMGGFEEEVEPARASGRPAVCTEFMARTFGNTLDNVLPFFSKYKFGWYVWGLCAGSAQYHFPWRWPEGSPPPKVWFHCLLYPDGTPYRDEEIELIRSFKWRD
jgi:hypothetical protein